MAQVYHYNNRPRVFTDASLPATVVPNSATDMLTIDTKFLTRIYVHLTVAVAALTGFSIKIKANKNVLSTAVDTLYSVSADFTLPKGLLVGSSGDLTIQGVGHGWFMMDVAGIDSVILNATSGGTATLLIEAGGST